MGEVISMYFFIPASSSDPEVFFQIVVPPLLVETFVVFCESSSADPFLSIKRGFCFKESSMVPVSLSRVIHGFARSDFDTMIFFPDVIWELIHPAEIDTFPLRT